MSFFTEPSAYSLPASGLLETLALFIKTIQLRPYVFVFFAASLFFAKRLIGWQRASLFFAIGWLTAFASEFSSTRTGIPFGWYHYTASTVRQEIYLSNVPFMDSLSFTMLLYASYCLALSFLLPSHGEGFSQDASLRNGRLLALRFDRSIRTSWPTFLLTALFFVFIDIVIDPVALRGDRWFLGKIYYYSTPGLHFGVPVANYVGWAVVGVITVWVYFRFDRHLPEPEQHSDRWITSNVLMGCGLYYSILLFNLTVTVWIHEPLIAMTGVLIYIPLTALLLLRLLGKLPAPTAWRQPDDWAMEGTRSLGVGYVWEVPSHWEPVSTVHLALKDRQPSSGYRAIPTRRPPQCQQEPIHTPSWGQPAISARSSPNGS